LHWHLSFSQLPLSKIIDTKIAGDPVQPGREFYPARVEPVSRHPKSNECLLSDIFSLGTVAGHAPGIIEYLLRMLVDDLPESRLASGKYPFNNSSIIFLNH
jgi:hypothetical protein